MGSLFKTPKAPKALDVQQSAKDIGAQSIKNANTASAFNRPNQVDAFGNKVSWNQTGTDASGNPTFTQTNTLGKTGQQYQQGLASLGKQYFATAGKGQGLDSQAAFDEAYGYASANLEPRMQRAEDQLYTALRNQGLDPTSEQFKSRSNDLALQNNEARNNLVTSLQGQMFNQNLAERQNQMSELQPGLSLGNTVLGQNSSPFAQTPVQGVDMQGLLGMNQQQQQQNYQAKLQKQQAGLGGLASIGGTLLGGFF
jgi:hypothetical protein